MFKTSVCSYPGRGNFGNSSYRGNCTGFIIKDLIESFLPQNGLFVDPSIGGGTSIDVANSMQVNFIGADLHTGFNLLTDSLSDYIADSDVNPMKRLSDLTFWHPPYADMIQYSGSQWGDKAYT